MSNKYIKNDTISKYKNVYIDLAFGRALVYGCNVNFSKNDIWVVLFYVISSSIVSSHGPSTRVSRLAPSRISKKRPSKKWSILSIKFLTNVPFLTPGDPRKSLITRKLEDEQAAPMWGRACVYIVLCMYIYIYIYAYVCMYVCMHACMYVYTCIYVSLSIIYIYI